MVASKFADVACPETALPRIADIDADRNHRRVLSRAEDSDIDIPAPEGFKYFPFQRAGIAYVLETDNTLIADEMGLGKTIQALGVINADETIKRVLVVCPASLKLNWKREAKKVLVRNFPVNVLVGKRLNPGSGRMAFTIVNYDILAKFETALPDNAAWDLLVADEAHYAKNPSAQRAKALARVAKRCKRRIFLTGTPVANRPVDVHALLKILKPDLFPNFKRFADRYCDAKYNGFGWDFTGHSNLEELQGILRESVMVRRLKKDVLTELPAKTRSVIEIPADTPELRDCVYNETGGDLMDTLKELFGSGRTAEQVVDEESGIDEIAEAAKLRHNTAMAKVAHVSQFVRETLESERKVIVFAHHRDVTDELMKELGEFNPVRITGDTSMENRQKAVDEFQYNQKVRVFVGNFHAAGVGLTLTKSRTVVFAELDWVPGNISQAEDRAHRIGQQDNVNVYHLVVQGSIDAWLAGMVVEKQDVIDRATDRNEASIDALKLKGLSHDVPMAYEVAAMKPRAVQLAEVGMTEEQVEIAASGLRILAGNCDHATSHDGVGFSMADAELGHMLAGMSAYTPRQAAVARNICLKYRRQLSGTGIVEELNA